MLQLVDKAIKKGIYTCRSEFMQSAIQQELTRCGLDKELTQRESYLLETVRKDIGLGFNEAFDVVSKAPKEYRIGSRKTLVKALSRLNELGFINWVKPEVKGRTHKSQFVLKGAKPK